MKTTTSVSGAAIRYSIDSALQCLRKAFRTGPGVAGWYHYLDDPAPGVTASAVGLFAFRSAGATFERTQDVLDYIAAQQVRGEPPVDGGWPVRTTRSFPITEATAWVVRCLGGVGVALPRGRGVLERGLNWLEVNQNIDLGWGSHKGQQSRVFTTALSMLALQEGGGSRSVIEDGHKWLVDAQSPGVPAWGPLPRSEPTLLHTAITLLALLPLHGSLTANDIQQTCEWMYARLEPGVQVERATSVEEYDVPYPDGARTVVFQNSLPHFASPVALSALLAAGWDPLQPKFFAVVNGIIAAQQDTGLWELPRSPLRPSIWAAWPFLSSLASFRDAVMPTDESRVTLMFPGCAIVQTEGSERPFTRRILLRNATFDWISNHKVSLILWLIAVASVLVPATMVIIGHLSVGGFVLALLVPALLLAFQITWEFRRRSIG